MTNKKIEHDKLTKKEKIDLKLRKIEFEYKHVESNRKNAFLVLVFFSSIFFFPVFFNAIESGSNFKIIYFGILIVILLLVGIFGGMKFKKDLRTLCEQFKKVK